MRVTAPTARRVVIVDDSRTIQAMLETAFGSRCDFRVVGVASDAESACELIRRVGPDLITIDLCMPYIDGAALLQMISGVRGACKIVISDQLAKSVLMQSKLETLGASLCLSKRELIDHPDPFFAKINAACDRTEATRQIPAIAPPTAPAGDPSAKALQSHAFGFPIPRDEAARLDVLRRKQLANAEHERQYDLITRHLAEIMAFPVCLLTFIDRDTQWIKSAHGFQETSMSRSEAFCAYTIAQDNAFVVTNAANDNRFSRNRLVVGEPNVRCYVGHPIIARDGTRIGAICLIDTKVRVVSRIVIDHLSAMAAIIAEIIETRPALVA